MSQSDRNADFSNELLDLEAIISQNTLQSILGQLEVANIAGEILAIRNSQTNSLLETATSETSSNRQESLVSNEIRPPLFDLSPLFAKIQANFDALNEMNLRLKEQLSIAVANNCISQIGEIESMLEMDQDEYETEENESQEDQDAWMILPEDQCSTSSVENHQSNDDHSSMCDICKRCFKNKTGLSIHKSVAHSIKSISTNGSNIQKKSDELLFQCDNCDRILKSRQGLISHQNACVNTGPRGFEVVFAETKFECHICQKTFSSNSTLKRHLRLH